jgi:hypothetical protein
MLRKQVPFVRLAKALASYREGWAWNAAREEIDAAISPAVNFADVAFMYLPHRAVNAKGLARFWLDFQYQQTLSTAPQRTGR